MNVSVLLCLLSYSFAKNLIICPDSKQKDLFSIPEEFQFLIRRCNLYELLLQLQHHNCSKLSMLR